MDATEIIFSVAGIAVAAIVVWGIVGLVNRRDKIDWRVWLASTAAWSVWIVFYWAWCAWRADAPEQKDSSFSFLVAPVWLLSGLFIIATEFYRFRVRPTKNGERIAWAIVSSLVQIVALLVVAGVGGMYVHLAAGGGF